MRFTLFAIALVLTACGSQEPIPPPSKPDTGVEVATPPDVPCGGACGAGTVCESGRCVPVDAGVMDALTEDLTAADVPAMDDGFVAEDIRVDPCATCAFSNARTTCSDAGVCSLVECLPGFADCDGQNTNGCERSINEAANCGGCANACPAGARCVDGRCSNCASPYNWCASSQRCVDLRTDEMNCGQCGVQCVGNLRACVNGVCCWASGGMCCPAGTARCSPGIGCGTNIDSDPLNCGGCSERCATGQRCVGGVCMR